MAGQYVGFAAIVGVSLCGVWTTLAIPHRWFHFLGVLPLVVSTGSGSEMRQAVGVAVFFGMLGVTLFGLIFTPIFYVLVRNLADRRYDKKAVASG